MVGYDLPSPLLREEWNRSASGILVQVVFPPRPGFCVTGVLYHNTIPVSPTNASGEQSINRSSTLTASFKPLEGLQMFNLIGGPLPPEGKSEPTATSPLTAIDPHDTATCVAFLRKLAFYAIEPRNRTLLGHAHGVSAIVSAMAFHIDNRSVQNYGSIILIPVRLLAGEMLLMSWASSSSFERRW